MTDSNPAVGNSFDIRLVNSFVSVKSKKKGFFEQSWNFLTNRLFLYQKPSVFQQKKTKRHFDFFSKIWGRHSIIQKHPEKVKVYHSIREINFRCTKLSFLSVFGHQFFHNPSFSRIKELFRKIFVSNLGSVIVTLREYQKAQLVLTFSDIATDKSPKNTSQFFLLGLNQKPSTCSRLLLRKIGGFVPWCTNMIVWNSQKLLWFLTPLDIQTRTSQKLRDWFPSKSLKPKLDTFTGGFDCKWILVFESEQW